MNRDLQRFFAHTKVEMSGCVVWTGSRKKTGYGFFGVNGKVVIAHRWIFQQVYGPQPGLVIMHRCDNPPCVNVDHLRVGTQADNIADSVSKGRRHVPGPRSECVNGHPMTPENTYTDPGGSRTCRLCRAQDRLKYRQNQKPLSIANHTHSAEGE